MNNAAAAMGKLSEALKAMGEAATNAIRAMADIVRVAFSPLLPVVQLQLAMEWAKTNRPKWYHMAMRCKKKRIRKKYTDRIMRDWEKERDALSKKTESKPT